jgi:hypothetical protein
VKNIELFTPTETIKMGITPLAAFDRAYNDSSSSK